MLDLLLPSTDAGVFLQFVVWAVVTAIAIVWTHGNKDFRLLVIGFSILTFSAMAIRAIH